MTICFATWQGFPWKKVPYYIFAQIFGAFMAGLFVYGQYHEQIVAYSAATIAAGKGTVFNGGPASIFCSFPGETQTNLGYLFMIEFFVDSYIGIIIWACLDPANPFVSPQAAPWAIGKSYCPKLVYQSQNPPPKIWPMVYQPPSHSTTLLTTFYASHTLLWYGRSQTSQ